jgi:ATP-dependent DNA helicase DinG
VLLGTASFWEGVDFPGSDLEILVLTRLPFAVPSDPLEMALTEEINQSGGQAFQDRSLPEAVLRFRQGFGRLIRRKTDRGVFLILDPRYYLTGYGGVFRRSLEMESGPVASPEEAADAVQKWFARDSLSGDSR